MRSLAVIVAVALASPAWAGPPKEVVKAIRAADAEWSAAASRKDAAAIAALYAEDAVAMPPNGAPAKGRAEIEALLKGFFDAGVTAIDITTRSIEFHGDVAIELADYSVTVTPPGKDPIKGADQGKSVVVWKKKKGKWQLYRDIWNSSLPPAPAPKS